MRFIFCILASCFIAVVTAAGQSGDNAGEAQPEIVPPDRIPPAPVLSPEEQIKSFKLPPGFGVEVVVSEPLVTAPVAMQFDYRGRLWVLEMNGYMRSVDGAGEQEADGSIAILEDTDGDGRMDRRQVFLDHLIMPRALMLYRGGAIVSEPPNLWWCPDNNGDGRADEKVLLFNDYASAADPRLGSKANPEHSSNGLLWGRDNWVYSANHTWRYHPDDENWIKEPTIFRGQWGLTQDDEGRFYYNSNSDQLRADLIPSVYLRRNRHLKSPFGVNVQLVRDQHTFPARVTPGVNRGYQPGQLNSDGRLATFTAACAPLVYRGGQFPPQYQGRVFLCEPSGNFIRCNRIIETDGLLSATNAFPDSEFLASTDERFRPVNLHNGPDGCLYIVDMARGVIQHRTYVTSYLRRQIKSRQLEAPLNLGRIYRVYHQGKTVSRTEKLATNPPTAELVARLSHPNGWWRDTAQQLLVERGDPAAIAPLREMALAVDAGQPMSRLFALWTLNGIGGLDLPTLEKALEDADILVRIAALRVSEGFLHGQSHAAAVNAIMKRAGFVEKKEMLQVLLSLGEIGSPASDAIMRILLMNTPPSTLRFDAAISGLSGRELEFLEALINDPLCATTKGEHAPLLAGLAQCVGVEAIPPRMERLLALAAERTPGDWRQVAILDGLLRMIPAPAKGKPAPRLRVIEFPAEPIAVRSLRNVELPGVQDRFNRLEPTWTWPGKPGASNIVEIIPLASAERESFARGREVYTLLCAPCHQPDGEGQDGLAPPLLDSEWVLGPDDRLIRILLHGVRDAITVRGRQYELNMPALGETLDDGQIADVLTYIRREWSHPAAPVKLNNVQSIRSLTEKRQDAWTEAELLAPH